MEVLPGCQNGETERDIRMMNRRERPKSTPFEVAKLQNSDRPLNEEEWGEMSIDRQRNTSGAMNLLKKEPSKKKEKRKSRWP